MKIQSDKKTNLVGKSNPKTINYISNEEPIEISPSEIIFKDIELNQTYEIIVLVRNLTKTSRRIRVFQP